MSEGQCHKTKTAKVIVVAYIFNEYYIKAKKQILHIRYHIPNRETLNNTYM